MSKPITVVGAGLAGCTLAWHLLGRGVSFTLIEDRPEAAGSLAAAGMLCPVTGKAFNPSWRIEEFYDPALRFYGAIEETLGAQLWYDYPVVRPFFDAKDRRKFQKKREERPALFRWVQEVVDEVPHAQAEHGAVIWAGSGRLNVRAYVERSRSYFASQGLYEERAVQGADQLKVYTTGARGLVDQNPVALPHRSAKGEILKVKVPGLNQEQILSRGTWCVPTGEEAETFLVGANYDWDDLSNTPTAQGRETVEKGLQTLITLPYEVVGHVAGVRPIVRRSEPVIGSLDAQTYYLNGLGSKGTLYAPRVAEILLAHLLDQSEVPDYLQMEL